MSYLGSKNNVLMPTDPNEYILMMQLEHEELDVVPKITFIAPKNVLNNNILFINDKPFIIEL